MPPVTLPVTVTCVCGACKLLAEAQPLIVYACHCETCQVTSGTDYQLNARFEPGQASFMTPSSGGKRAWTPQASILHRKYIYLDRKSMCTAENMCAIHPCLSAQLGVVKGEDNIASVRLPGSSVRRHYCATCHVRVFHERFTADGSGVEVQASGGRWLINFC